MENTVYTHRHTAGNHHINEAKTVVFVGYPHIFQITSAYHILKLIDTGAEYLFWFLLFLFFIFFPTPFPSCFAFNRVSFPWTSPPMTTPGKADPTPRIS